jgi:hypothetical protein
MLSELVLVDELEFPIVSLSLDEVENLKCVSVESN